MLGRGKGVGAAVLALSVLMSLAAPTPALAADAVEQAAGQAGGQVEPEELGRVATLPAGSRDHWVWVSDRPLRHNQLFDGDSGRALGTLDVALSLTGRLPLTSRELNEFYVVESVYSRGHRGTRADFVTIYDADTLSVKGEIEIPPHAAETGGGVALTAMLDGGRFLVVYNQMPPSVTVVDVKLRSVAGSIDAAGCACVYPTGERSFGMLCGDGTALHVSLDTVGRERSIRHSARLFDAVADPLTEKGVRTGTHWLFASFDGYLHDVDFAGEVPELADRWSLFTDEQRTAKWRIGGVQHLAMHEKTGELYSIVHQGGTGTHKDPGAEIWVYDRTARARVRTMKAPALTLAFIRPLLKIERESPWFLVLSYVESMFAEPGVHSIVVTQDAEPLLFVRNSDIGAVGVLDARSGKTLREIEEVGISGVNMALP